jgi:hypothetical protein
MSKLFWLLGKQYDISVRKDVDAVLDLISHNQDHNEIHRQTMVANTLMVALLSTMSTLDEDTIRTELGKSQSTVELTERTKTLRANDQTITAGSQVSKLINIVNLERRRELREEQLRPFEDEAKRFTHGQKVYFATECQSVDLGWDFKTVKGSDKSIKAGQWCRVYAYQAKSKRLWLYQPGKPANHKNVINSHFSLRDMQHYGISRTELSLRQA